MANNTKTKRPNFLIIVADDLGYSDLGCFGSEIPTPNIDRIAAEGVRLSSFHTASACSPTRAMLLSGTDNHIAGLGQMAEYMWSNEGYDGVPGYEGYLNEKVAALPEILEDAGYETMISGKWHLGWTPERFPDKRGFQKSFAYLPGAGNHYNYEPDTPEGYSIKFMPPLYTKNGVQIDHKDLPADFYSTDYFASTLLGHLDERDQEKPFFAYLPFTAPHWPLHAPEDEIAKYKGRYDGGYEALRQSRLKRLAELGLIDEDVTPHPVVSSTKVWDELSKSEKAISARKMEVYAAMVSKMDTAIGRVLDYLSERGDLDNTFVLFMSDNGAEGAVLEAEPRFSTAWDPKYFDNSLENIGRGNSMTWYGPRWAQASTAPGAMYKAWITEGGIHCPAVVRYPGIQLPRNHIADTFTTVMDILPTILDIANVPPPGTIFRGKPVVNVRGKSWLGYLKGEAEYVHDDNVTHGWELFGQQAIRQGKWKAIFIPAPAGREVWELFDLKSDPGENHDLAEKFPEKLDELVKSWLDYVADTGLVQVPGAYSPMHWDDVKAWRDAGNSA